MKVTPQDLESVRPWSDLTAPLLSGKGHRVGQTEYKSAPLGKLLHSERVSDGGRREGEGGMAARFCVGGFIFMPRLGALHNHHLAWRKKRTADSILSRDSFNYHLVLKQQPTPSAISPSVARIVAW